MLVIRGPNLFQNGHRPPKWSLPSNRATLNLGLERVRRAQDGQQFKSWFTSDDSTSTAEATKLWKPTWFLRRGSCQNGFPIDPIVNAIKPSCPCSWESRGLLLSKCKGENWGAPTSAGSSTCSNNVWSVAFSSTLTKPRNLSLSSRPVWWT